MEKKQYIIPDMEITEFETEDIINNSTPDDTTPIYPV